MRSFGASAAWQHPSTEQSEPVILQPEAKTVGFLFEQPRQTAIVYHFDDLASRDVDQMGMRSGAGTFVSCLAVAEHVTRDQTRIREAVERAIDRGDSDPAAGGRSAMDLEGAGMISRGLQNFQHDAPLLGQSDAALAAKRLQPIHPLTS